MRSGPTPEFTCRESTPSCDKFSMKGKLIPVRCNELFGGNLRRDHPPLMMLLFSSLTQCYFYLEAQPPNARINRARDAADTRKSCMKGSLTRAPAE